MVRQPTVLMNVCRQPAAPAANAAGYTQAPPRRRSPSPPRRSRSRSRSRGRRRSRSRSRSRGRRSRSRSRSGGRSGGRGGSKTGVVGRWNNDRGFGFITPDEGGEDLFCHVSQITDGNALEEGRAVSYDVSYDDRRQKYRAQNVTGGVTMDRAPPRRNPGICFDFRSIFFLPSWRVSAFRTFLTSCNTQSNECRDP